MQLLLQLGFIQPLNYQDAFLICQRTSKNQSLESFVMVSQSAGIIVTRQRTTSPMTEIEHSLGEAIPFLQQIHQGDKKYWTDADNNNLMYYARILQHRLGAATAQSSAKKYLATRSSRRWRKNSVATRLKFRIMARSNTYSR